MTSERIIVLAMAPLALAWGCAAEGGVSGVVFVDQHPRSRPGAEQVDVESEPARLGSPSPPRSGGDSSLPTPVVPDSTTVFRQGVPLEDTPIGQWTRIAIEGAVCADGSQAGFSIRRSSTSDNVLIYQQVGGACFNRSMCSVSKWGGAPFQQPSGQGIFDFDHPDNPVRDLNMIFIPYCTGDVHAGSRPSAQVEGVSGERQFVGGDNYRLYLQRIVPTFPRAEKVVFAGWSAGGFGTLFNYVDTRRAFGHGVQVVAISDGGPPMGAPYLPACLAQKLRTTWDLDEYLPRDCVACFQEGHSGLIGLLEYIFDTYPDAVYGLVSAYEDSVIRMFFSYGLNDCRGTLGARYPPEMYREGLLQLKRHFMARSRGASAMGTYYFHGQDHGRIDRASFYRQTVRDERLVDWFAAVVEGEPYHVAH